MASTTMKLGLAALGVTLLLGAGCAPSPSGPGPVATPTPTHLVDPVASVAVDPSVKLCDVDAVIPESKYVNLGSDVYRDGSLTLTVEGSSMTWAKAGASGIAFTHPEPERLSAGENPVTGILVEDNWVLFNVFGLSAAEGAVALYAWDADNPDQPAKRLSSEDRVDVRGGSMTKKVAGHHVVWTEWGTETEGTVMLHDLSTGTTTEVATTTGAQADLLDQDTVVWQVAGDIKGSYALAGHVISTGQPWTPPAGMDQLFSGFWGFAAVDGNWVFELYPQSESEEAGAYVMMAWPKGASAPYEFSRTAYETFHDGSLGAGQGYFAFLEPAGEDVFTYVLDIDRGIRFKVREGWGAVTVREDRVVVSAVANPEATEYKQGEITFAELDQLSCS